MKKCIGFVVLVAALCALVLPATASATTRYCSPGNRACWRNMLLANCVPVNAAYTVWTCPDAAPHKNTQATVWYWSRRAAERYILNRRTTSDGEDLIEVHCVGMGRRWRGLYHRFACDEQDDLYREFNVRATAVSRYRMKVVEITCDASDSDYECP